MPSAMPSSSSYQFGASEPSAPFVRRQVSQQPAKVVAGGAVNGVSRQASMVPPIIGGTYQYAPSGQPPPVMRQFSMQTMSSTASSAGLPNHGQMLRHQSPVQLLQPRIGLGFDLNSLRRTAPIERSQHSTSSRGTTPVSSVGIHASASTPGWVRAHAAPSRAGPGSSYHESQLNQSSALENTGSTVLSGSGVASRSARGVARASSQQVGTTTHLHLQSRGSQQGGHQQSSSTSSSYSRAAAGPSGGLTPSGVVQHEPASQEALIRLPTSAAGMSARIGSLLGSRTAVGVQPATIPRSSTTASSSAARTPVGGAASNVEGFGGSVSSSKATTVLSGVHSSGGVVQSSHFQMRGSDHGSAQQVVGGGTTRDLVISNRISGTIGTSSSTGAGDHVAVGASGVLPSTTSTIVGPTSSSTARATSSSARGRFDPPLRGTTPTRGQRTVLQPQQISSGSTSHQPTGQSTMSSVRSAKSNVVVGLTGSAAHTPTQMEQAYFDNRTISDVERLDARQIAFAVSRSENVTKDFHHEAPASATLIDRSGGQMINASASRLSAELHQAGPANVPSASNTRSLRTSQQESLLNNGSRAGSLQSNRSSRAGGAYGWRQYQQEAAMRDSGSGYRTNVVPVAVVSDRGTMEVPDHDVVEVQASSVKAVENNVSATSLLDRFGVSQSASNLHAQLEDSNVQDLPSGGQTHLQGGGAGPQTVVAQTPGALGSTSGAFRESAFMGASGGKRFSLESSPGEPMDMSAIRAKLNRIYELVGKKHDRLSCLSDHLSSPPPGGSPLGLGGASRGLSSSSMVSGGKGKTSTSGERPATWSSARQLREERRPPQSISEEAKNAAEAAGQQLATPLSSIAPSVVGSIVRGSPAPSTTFHQTSTAGSEIKRALSRLGGAGGHSASSSSSSGEARGAQGGTLEAQKQGLQQHLGFEKLSAQDEAQGLTASPSISPDSDAGRHRAPDSQISSAYKASATAYNMTNNRGGVAGLRDEQQLSTSDYSPTRKHLEFNPNEISPIPNEYSKLADESAAKKELRDVFGTGTDDEPASAKKDEQSSLQSFHAPIVEGLKLTKMSSLQSPSGSSGLLRSGKDAVPSRSPVSDRGEARSTADAAVLQKKIEFWQKYATYSDSGLVLECRKLGVVRNLNSRGEMMQILEEKLLSSSSSASPPTTESSVGARNGGNMSKPRSRVGSRGSSKEMSSGGRTPTGGHVELARGGVVGSSSRFTRPGSSTSASNYTSGNMNILGGGAASGSSTSPTYNNNNYHPVDAASTRSTQQVGPPLQQAGSQQARPRTTRSGGSSRRGSLGGDLPPSVTDEFVVPTTAPPRKRPGEPSFSVKSSEYNNPSHDQAQMESSYQHSHHVDKMSYNANDNPSHDQAQMESSNQYSHHVDKMSYNANDNSRGGRNSVRTSSGSYRERESDIYNNYDEQAVPHLHLSKERGSRAAADKRRISMDGAGNTSTSHRLQNSSSGANFGLGENELRRESTYSFREGESGSTAKPHDSSTLQGVAFDAKTEEILRACFRKYASRDLLKKECVTECCQLVHDSVAEGVARADFVEDKIESWFGRFDYDGDGRISFDEFAALCAFFVAESAPTPVRLSYGGSGNSSTTSEGTQVIMDAASLDADFEIWSPDGRFDALPPPDPTVEVLFPVSFRRWRCESRETGQTYAVVKVCKTQLNLPQDLARRELRKYDLAAKRNRNLLPFSEKFESTYSYYLLRKHAGLELAVYWTRMGSIGETRPYERWLAEVMRQLLKATAFLHQERLVHGNICASTIHVEEHGPGSAPGMALAESGLTALFRHQESWALRAQPVDLLHEAPDAECAVSAKGDVWALGAIFFQFLTGKTLPFCVQGDRAACLREELDESTRVASGVSPLASSLCLAMLSEDPQLRPSARLCLQHEWFTARSPNTVLSPHQELALQPQSLHAVGDLELRLRSAIRAVAWEFQFPIATAAESAEDLADLQEFGLSQDTIDAVAQMVGLTAEPQLVRLLVGSALTIKLNEVDEVLSSIFGNVNPHVDVPVAELIEKLEAVDEDELDQAKYTLLHFLQEEDTGGVNYETLRSHMCTYQVASPS
ncbi:unnamed protein product [Amoebophrya sp. A25]|nr:unnamed protein product [Amoebophrya sp. A25]|eukprot:GSA25T00004433001.1